MVRFLYVANKSTTKCDLKAFPVIAAGLVYPDVMLDFLVLDETMVGDGAVLAQVAVVPLHRACVPSDYISFQAHGFLRDLAHFQVL